MVCALSTRCWVMYSANQACTSLANEGGALGMPEHHASDSKGMAQNREDVVPRGRHGSPSQGCHVPC
jgi:hypothetical protein